MVSKRRLRPYCHALPPSSKDCEGSGPTFLDRGMRGMVIMFLAMRRALRASPRLLRFRIHHSLLWAKLWIWSGKMRFLIIWA